MWKMMQCAVRGRGHEWSHIPCQDKTFFLEACGVSALSLADGAGSAKLSHFGAENVTETVCKILVQHFDEFYEEKNAAVVKQYFLHAVLERLRNLAEYLGCEIGDLASTLLFVAIKDKKFLIGHIGDGVIGYSKNQEIKVVSAPQNGEFANTTFFTTSSQALNVFRLIKGTTKKGIDGFVLMSDGSEASFYNKKHKALGKGVLRLMNLLRICVPVELSSRFNSFMYNCIRFNTIDDCSMALIVKREERNFNEESIKLRASLLNVSLYDKCARRRIKKYQQLLEGLAIPSTRVELVRKSHIHKKHIKKDLIALMNANLIECSNGYYYSAIEKDVEA